MKTVINWITSNYQWLALGLLLVVATIVVYLIFNNLKNSSEQPSGDDAYRELGKEFGLSAALICAVAKVESSGTGYLPDGRPKILFEGHVFWKELRQRGFDPNAYTAEYGNVLYPTWDKSKYGASGANQHERLKKAEQLCKKLGISREAALNAASWGKFQIMGFNADRAGYPSTQAMVDDFTKNPTDYTNVKAFLNFCRDKGLIAKLKNKDWRGFAYGYNGAGYAKNAYHTKLAQAYEDCQDA